MLRKNQLSNRKGWKRDEGRVCTISLGETAGDEPQEYGVAQMVQGQESSSILCRVVTTALKQGNRTVGRARPTGGHIKVTRLFADTWQPLAAFV